MGGGMQYCLVASLKIQSVETLVHSSHSKDDVLGNLNVLTEQRKVRGAIGDHRRNVGQIAGTRSRWHPQFLVPPSPPTLRSKGDRCAPTAMPIHARRVIRAGAPFLPLSPWDIGDFATFREFFGDCSYSSPALPLFEDLRSGCDVGDGRHRRI